MSYHKDVSKNLEIKRLKLSSELKFNSIYSGLEKRATKSS